MWIHGVPDELIIYNNIMSKRHRVSTESFPIFFSRAVETQNLRGTRILEILEDVDDDEFFWGYG